MATFSHPDFDDHEEVVFVREPAADLTAIIAIHRRGPMAMAAGGCRMWPYATDDEALTDALRLSRAMTYKLAVVGLPAGGAKAVVLADPARKHDALLEALGAAVDRLGGRYVVAQDVGTDAADMQVIRRRTPFVATGRGDSAAATAYGVFCGLAVAVRRRLGRDGLRGLKVAVQGAGGVGLGLARRLVEAGARVYIADPRPEAVRRAVETLGVEAVPPDALLGLEVDVLAPCALGRVIDDASLPRLRCAVIAGGANDQLAERRHGDALARRGILYAPDFVINAGGVLGAAAGAAADTTEAQLLARAAKVAEHLEAVFARAEAEGVPPHEAAERTARERLGGAR